MTDYTYEPILDNNGIERTDVIGRSDGAIIPVADDNSDYQAYLAYLASLEETE
jgi:hypothetical protein